MNDIVRAVLALLLCSPAWPAGRMAAAGLEGGVDPGLVGPALANRSVSKILPRSDGTAIVQGSFNTYDGVRTGTLARIQSSGLYAAPAYQLPGVGPEDFTPLLEPAPQDGLWMLYPTTAYRLHRFDAQGVELGTLDPAQAFGAVFNTIAPAADGKLYAGGDFRYYPDGITGYNHLLRLNSDLTLDTSFAMDEQLDGGVSYSLLQPDGRLLISGSFFSVGVQTTPGHFARILPNATPDLTFTPGSGLSSGLPPVPLFVDAQGRSYWTSLSGGPLTDFNGVARNILVRLLPDGTVDPSFDAQLGLRDGVSAVRQTASGQLLVAGFFRQIGGGARTNLARLQDSGALDPTFQAAVQGLGSVECLAAAPGGRWLVGGGFSSLSGSPRSGLGRIEADGALDASFAPAPGPGDGAPNVQAVLALPDGGFLLGGGFGEQAPGIRSPTLLRLRPDGTIDPAFQADPDGSVRTILRLPDGRLLICGGFQVVGGLPRQHLARLQADGSVDPTFAAGSGFDAIPLTMQLLSDGSIVVVGPFRNFDGQSAPGIVRLTADGQRFPGFNPGSGLPLGRSVLGLAVGPGDRIVLTGSFTSYAGATRYRVVELLPSGALSASALGVTQVITSGTARAVAIDADGNTFVSRNSRIYRFNAAGVHDAGYSVTLQPDNPANLVNALLPHPDGTLLAGGSAVYRLLANGALDPTFTPPAALTRDFGYAVGAGNPGSVRTLAFGPNRAAILVGGYFHTLGGLERRGFARLLARPYEAWLGTYFSAAELANPAVAGDFADPDGDGIPNLLEYALALDPRAPSASGLPSAALVDRQGTSALELVFRRPKLPRGVIYAVEVSSDLQTWSPATTTEVEVVDEGSRERVTLRESAAPSGGQPRFLRLRVARG